MKRPDDPKPTRSGEDKQNRARDTKPLRSDEHDPLADLEEAEELLAELGEEFLSGAGSGEADARAADSSGGDPSADDPSGPAGAPGVGMGSFGSRDSSDLSSLATEKAKAEAWSEAQAFQSLAAAACSITANLDFASLIRQVLDSAITTVGAERGIIFLGEEGDEQLVPVVARSVDGEDVRSFERISQTILERSRLGDATLSSDACEDPGLADIPSVRLHEIRTVLCAPMKSRGRTVGVIYIDSPSRARPFPSHAAKFLEAFAGLAAVSIENSQLHGDVLRENRRLRRRLHSLDSFGRIVTVSSHMTAVLRRASMVAQVDAPIMVLGESGTGKELLARSIHEASPRSLNPFVAHNCAAVPRDLMESIFFGHTKGAFTGASREALGLFRMADRGTLFLDEFAELDLDIQAKLLRVLQDGMVRPVGGETEVHVDFRLITATSRNIEQAVEVGGFREDLFYRTNVLEVQIPPLRERLEDIPVLVDHFRDKYSGADGAPQIRFGAEAIEYLQDLPWRGNVRELENVVQRILVLCEHETVTAKDVARLVRLRRADAHPSAHSTQVSQAPQAPAGGEAPSPPSFGSARTHGSESGAPSPGLVGGSQSVGSAGNDRRTLAEREREDIIAALRRAGGNKSKAARFLGLHRNSLLRRIERYNIELDLD